MASDFFRSPASQHHPPPSVMASPRTVDTPVMGTPVSTAVSPRPMPVVADRSLINTPISQPAPPSMSYAALARSPRETTDSRCQSVPVQQVANVSAGQAATTPNATPQALPELLTALQSLLRNAQQQVDNASTDAQRLGKSTSTQTLQNYAKPYALIFNLWGSAVCSMVTVACFKCARS